MPNSSESAVPAGRVVVAPAPGRFNLTTRQWLWTAVASTLAVLSILGALGVWVFNLSSADTSAVVDRHTPALVQAVRLETAFINQETGVRGYGLSGRTDFLQPYTDGLAQQEAAAAQLRKLFAGDPRNLAELDKLLADADAWQSYFARPTAAAAPDVVQALTAQRVTKSKALFDTVRADTAAQQAHLQSARVAARQALTNVNALRDWVFAAIAVVIFVVAVLIFEGLRRGVTSPLAQLAADARQVADGDLDHPIAGTGPADLRQLADDVEGMRRRLRDELMTVDEGRRQLDAQTVELQRSNAELEQFAYVASHDLQEPLRKVASFCQLLQRRYGGQLDERADQYIEYAVDGANRMQTLIQDLLAFSRVGRTQEPYDDVDLEAVFNRALDSLSIAVSESGAEVTHDALPVVSGNATQLGMLFQNLVGNAIKFRDPARPSRVHVSATRTRDGDEGGVGAEDGDGAEGMWTVAVSDNGIGIGSEYTDRVFTIFQRLHPRDAYPGNGIGLAVCRKIVEFHGGRIAVDPEYAPGTRIVFTLPSGAALDGETSDLLAGTLVESREESREV
ncbi:sensor histidine kinase [Catenulispora yoronensis]|uniref:sensor histidine kinase n=1 Tax=Catenulispora yoronensis TaxID=450799 RepID=UPI0031E18D11